VLRFSDYLLKRVSLTQELAQSKTGGMSKSTDSEGMLLLRAVLVKSNHALPVETGRKRKVREFQRRSRGTI
jgi:hypothetical protein